MAADRSSLRHKSRHAATPPGGASGDVLVKTTGKDYEFEWSAALQAGGTRENVINVPVSSGSFLSDFNSAMPKIFLADAQEYWFYYAKEGVTRLWLGPKSIAVGKNSGYSSTFKDYHMVIQENLDGGTWPGQEDTQMPIGRLPSHIWMRIMRGFAPGSAPSGLREGILASNPTDKKLWIGNQNNVPVLLNGPQVTDVNTYYAAVDGDGNVWDDVNVMNFGGHPQSEGTKLKILVNDVWFFEHNGLTYVYIRNDSDDYTIGAGGSYVTTADDFYAVQGSPVQEVVVRYDVIDPSIDLPSDVNDKDFSGNLGSEGTAQRIDFDEMWVFFYNSVPHLWIGPKNVLIGLGGNYTTTSDDFLPLISKFAVYTYSSPVLSVTGDFVEDFNNNNFASHSQGQPNGSLYISLESVWVFPYTKDKSIRIWLGPKDVYVGRNTNIYEATADDFIVLNPGVGTREWTAKIYGSSTDNFLFQLNAQDFTGHPLAGPNGGLVLDPQGDFVFDWEPGNSYRYVGVKNVTIGGSLPTYIVVEDDIAELVPISDAGYF